MIFCTEDNIGGAPMKRKKERVLQSVKENHELYYKVSLAILCVLIIKEIYGIFMNIKHLKRIGKIAKLARVTLHQQ